jgi:hypothetical protein
MDRKRAERFMWKEGDLTFLPAQPENVPVSVSLAQFRQAVDSLDGRELETEGHRRRFTVHVLVGSLAYTPSSSGVRRKQSWEEVAAVLEHFNQVHSWKPVDYVNVTRNASYLLAVLRATKLVST